MAEACHRRSHDPGRVGAGKAGPPPEVFRTRLRVTPVVTLLVLAVVLANLAATNVDVHGVRGLSDAVEPQTSRPFLVAATDLGPATISTKPAPGNLSPRTPSVF